MKIVLFGGFGKLGEELYKLNPEIVRIPREDVDICHHDDVIGYLIDQKPDVVINAAAETDNRKIEKFPSAAIRSNIIGASNLSLACMSLGVRLVYISTDYIYKGDRGNYKENDEILPFNLYSWTKLGGECSTKCVKNHLIIRTSFGSSDFDYPEAFTDKYSSKDYIDVIAPMILEAATSPLTGVINIGSERKSLYDYASKRNKSVKPVKVSDTNYFTPLDTSLNLQNWINYKSDKSIAKPHSKCRMCGSSSLVKYIDLGLMPLANNLEFTAVRAKEKQTFPLQVMLCEECYLSQLSVVIDPEAMFSYYTYRSSVNQGYVNHCKSMALSLKEKLNLTSESFHIDIAGNDGALLKQFKDIIGLKVLNVDPATNLVAIAESNGVESKADFWSIKVSEEIVQSHGKADLITATNVFAHVDNVRDFLQACKLAIKDQGVIVLEFPYLVDFIEQIEFDTVYFEHLSYMSVYPLDKLCSNLGLKIISVEKQSIHGGTIRVSIAKLESNIQVLESVKQFILSEKLNGFTNVDVYKAWSESVKATINEFSSSVLELKKNGFKIAAFGASAKGNTLLNSASMNTDIISYIADETPEKIGKYSPKTGIPIVNKQHILKDTPDYIIILSWNFAEEIMAKLNKIYSGKYIIPIPKFKVV